MDVVGELTKRHRCARLKSRLVWQSHTAAVMQKALPRSWEQRAFCVTPRVPSRLECRRGGCLAVGDWSLSLQRGVEMSSDWQGFAPPAYVRLHVYMHASKDSFRMV